MTSTISIHTNDQQIFKYFKIFSLKNISFFILFIITVFCVYYVPNTISYLLILGYIIAFIISKRDYYWFAFFFILYSTPMGLFSESTADAIHRLPLFSLASSFSFSTCDLFVIVAFLKAIQRKGEFQYTFQKPLIILLFYFIFLLFLAVFFHHTPLTVVIEQVRGAFYFSLLYSIPKLLPNKISIYKFFSLISPFIFVIFLGGIYFFISNGDYLYYLINPYAEIRQLNLEIQDPFDSRFFLHSGQFVLIFVVYIYSLIHLQLTRAKNLYFITLAIICYTLIIMAALRSWFIIFGIILGVYLLNNRNKFRNIFYFSLVASLIIIPIISNKMMIPGISAAWNRTATVFQLGQKESLSTQSVKMKTEVRLPHQLLYIWENPVTGWGFTDRKADPDTGNFGLLVQVGFLGFSLFIYFWIKYLLIIQNTKKALANDNLYRYVLNILLASFLGLLISHFTTNQIFGTHFFPVLLSTFFFLSDYYIKEASNNTVQFTSKT